MTEREGFLHALCLVEMTRRMVSSRPAFSLSSRPAFSLSSRPSWRDLRDFLRLAIAHISGKAERSTSLEMTGGSRIDRGGHRNDIKFTALNLCAPYSGCQ